MAKKVKEGGGADPGKDTKVKTVAAKAAPKHKAKRKEPEPAGSTGDDNSSRHVGS